MSSAAQASRGSPAVLVAGDAGPRLEMDFLAFGVDCVSAPSGAEAAQRLRATFYPFVVVPHLLQDMSGVDFVQSLLRHVEATTAILIGQEFDPSLVQSLVATGRVLHFANAADGISIAQYVAQHASKITPPASAAQSAPAPTILMHGAAIRPGQGAAPMASPMTSSGTPMAQLMGTMDPPPGMGLAPAQPMPPLASIAPSSATARPTMKLDLTQIPGAMTMPTAPAMTAPPSTMPMMTLAGLTPPQTQSPFSPPFSPLFATAPPTSPMPQAQLATMGQLLDAPGPASSFGPNHSMPPLAAGMPAPDEIERVQRLEDQLVVAQQELARAAADTATLRASVAQATADATTAQQEARRLRADVETSDQELARMRGEVESARRGAAEAAADVEDHRARLAQAAAELAEARGAEDAAKQLLLAERSAGGAHAAAAEESTRVLAERDAQIAALHAVVAELDAQIAALQVLVAERDGVVAGMQAAVVEARAAVSEREAVLEEGRKGYDELQRLFVEKDRRAAELEAAHSELTAALIERDASLATKDVQLGAMNAQLAMDDEGMTALRAELEAVCRSENASAAQLAIAATRIEELSAALAKALQDAATARSEADRVDAERAAVVEEKDQLAAELDAAMKERASSQRALGETQESQRLSEELQLELKHNYVELETQAKALSDALHLAQAQRDEAIDDARKVLTNIDEQVAQRTRGVKSLIEALTPFAWGANRAVQFFQERGLEGAAEHLRALQLMVKAAEKLSADVARTDVLQDGIHVDVE